MNSFRERWSGIAPVNVRGVGESRKIVKQTDSVFGVDVQADPGGPFAYQAFAFAYQASLHDLCHGWELPCWLLAVLPSLVQP